MPTVCAAPTTVPSLSKPPFSIPPILASLPAAGGAGDILDGESLFQVAGELNALSSCEELLWGVFTTSRGVPGNIHQAC